MKSKETLKQVFKISQQFSQLTLIILMPHMPEEPVKTNEVIMIKLLKTTILPLIRTKRDHLPLCENSRLLPETKRIN